MKAAVIYSSMTGHSKSIAQAVSEALDIKMYDVNDNPDIQGCELIFVISGIYAGKAKPELLEFAQGLTPQGSKRAALITSSMKMQKQAELRKVLAGKGIVVEEEEYTCKGGFLIFARSHPNEKEIRGAVEFAKKHMK